MSGLPDERLRRYPYLPAYGVGVTAYDYGDALRLLRKWVLQDSYDMPEISRVTQGVNVSQLLEQPFGRTRLLPHLGCPVWRGVWHPAYNLWYGADTER